MKLLLLSLVTLLLRAAAPFPYPTTQHDFPNGLRLITIRTEFPNLLALYVVVQAGSRNEVDPGRSGFAHLFEHMMFHGTEQTPAEKYQQILQRAGADSNAFTSDDLTAYRTVFSRDDLEQMLRIEADRFRNLQYPAAGLKTESLAVLGEYNKNSSNPVTKLDEAMREAGFQRHPYGHSTMGFLKDVQAMPEQYEYSRQFFDHYYRPEYTTIVIAGDVDAAKTRALVERYWGGWQRGSYRAEIPVEPAQKGAQSRHVEWPAATLPWLVVAFRGPAYTDTEKDTAAMGAIAFLGFSHNSDLYQKLVIQEQKVDALYASNPDHVDPYLFGIIARVKKDTDLPYVQERVLATVKELKEGLVAMERLEAVKSHLRYSFSLRMDSNQSIAETAARAVALRRTPETLNRLYALYAELTPEDIRTAARRYLIEDGRIVVTLTGKAATR